MPETVINFQSPYTAQSLIDHVGTATPTTAVCWLLKPDPASPLYASGIEVRATSHDRPLVLPGHGSGSFLPGVAGFPSAIDTESGHDSAGLQYETVFSSAGITRESLTAGDWVRARVSIYTVNVAALGMGQLVEFVGFLGKADEEGGDVARGGATPDGRRPGAGRGADVRALYRPAVGRRALQGQPQRPGRGRRRQHPRQRHSDAGRERDARPGVGAHAGGQLLRAY
ncbi:MAG TPA: DUF2163 domain-containing protein [Pyrinomonadaceae bacterium]